jgi:transposase
LSNRAIARASSVGVGTVSNYVRRAAAAGLSWPLPAELDDAALEAKLFPPPPPRGTPRPLPDFGWIHQELRRPGVTLQLLWHEYLEVHPSGYRYTQFCERYRQWRAKLRPAMRQVHRAGEKSFVDYSGKHPHLVDRRTGELVPVELFVGVLGASSYTYAEATPTQELEHWISAHEQMLRHFGGSSEIWVCDNLKSGVATACRYEPNVNRTYADLAEHYGAVVIPARPYHPKDKAKVETAILVAQRWILAALRDETFFCLGDLNRRIRELLELLNDKPMQKLGVSRRELFERIDRPALRPLPASRYEITHWKPCRVNIDYHVEVAGNYYSVPYQLVHESVEACYTHSSVQILFKGKRVASHARLRGKGKHSTRPEHMPASHRAHAEWNPSRLIGWAERTGPATGRVVANLLESFRHPEQGYRSCLGIMRLAKRYGTDRVEAACSRAEHLGSCRYRTVKNILAAGMDRLPLEVQQPPTTSVPPHDNIRGPAYYGKDT